MGNISYLFRIYPETPACKLRMYSSLKLLFYVQFCVFKAEDVFVDVHK